MTAPETDIADPALLHSLRRAGHIAVFTGAGVSAESGIPTFRDALTGLWERFNAEDLATPEAFQRDPALVWGWYEWRRAKVKAATPNPAHFAIAAMAHHVPRSTLITQNVDDLHERAGSRDVIHLHGSIDALRCHDCSRSADAQIGNQGEPEGGRRLPPPRCTHCGGPIRPGVVWFGEALPQDALTRAFEAAEQCDLLFSIGTSSLVYPAAAIPEHAARQGVVLVQVNPNPTSLDRLARYNLRGAAGLLMPALVAAAWER
jgi:NAD-dependent deacetylase